MKTQIINKKHYQECDVVTLPVLNENSLKSDRRHLIYQDNKLFNPFKNEYFNLYILSNEEIKESDWYMVTDFSKQEDVRKSVKNITREEQRHNGYKKIISTTNKELTIIGRNISYPILGQTITYLPQIPQQFIDYFVSEYNKGNVISKVLVEVEEYDKGYSNKGTSSIPSSFSYWQGMGLKIKLNQNNEVNILTKQKQVFSREEVIALITKYNWDSDAANDAWKDKWLEQNL
jgi:hypothetical protein